MDLKPDVQKNDVRRIIADKVKANDNGTIRFTLISKTVDSYGEVVLPKGSVLDRIKTNPIWLWSHNLEDWGGLIRPPIGKMIVDSIEITEEVFDVDVEFDEDNDPFAKMIAEKHRDGYLNASSVGFRPITISTDTVLPKQTGVTHEKYLVLEGSSVPIPANPEALDHKGWGSFLEACSKYGFGIESFRKCMNEAHYPENVIKDFLDTKEHFNGTDLDTKKYVIEDETAVQEINDSIKTIANTTVEFSEAVKASNIVLTDEQQTSIQEAIEGLVQLTDIKAEVQEGEEVDLVKQVLEDERFAESIKEIASDCIAKMFEVEPGKLEEKEDSEESQKLSDEEMESVFTEIVNNEAQEG